MDDKLGGNGGVFAQMAGNGGGGPGVPDEAIVGIILVVGLIFLVIALAIAILYLRTLSKCLERCSPGNRTMEPGQVWLNLIPCFNLVWQFVTVIRISESLKNEFRSRGSRVTATEDYGRTLGLTYLIMNLLTAIPYLGMISGLVGLVCFIMYWVKIAGYSKELETGPSFRDDYDSAGSPQDDYDDRRDDDRRDDGDDKPWKRG